jgi:hypothetical protein
LTVRSKPLESLAQHLAGRDVRAIVRGALDGATFWVLFGPGDDGHQYRVDNYVWKDARWQPGGESFSADDTPADGWDMFGILFVRAFTQA